MEGSAVTTTQVLIDNNQLGKLWGKLPEIFPQYTKFLGSWGGVLVRINLLNTKFLNFIFNKEPDTKEEGASF